MGTELERIRSPAAFFGFGADSDSKICRQRGLRNGFGVQVFGLGADAESYFCDSAHLWSECGIVITNVVYRTIIIARSLL